MNNCLNKKWYTCKKDGGITLGLMSFAFTTWPFLTKGWMEPWFAIFGYVVFLVFIETLLICRKHFWAWTCIATLGITACIISTWIISNYWSSFPKSMIAGIKEFTFTVLLFSLYSSLLIFPISIWIYRSRKQTKRVAPYLLLWPISWTAGIKFKYFTGYKMDELVTIHFAMNLAGELAISAFVIFMLAAYLFDQTTDGKRHTLLQWLSIFSWLPAGLIPGLYGLGWKYSLYATVFPLATIYYFFELSKQALLTKDVTDL